MSQLTAILNSVGTGDLGNITDYRPKSWNDMILRYMPNGGVPITAFTAMMSSQQLTDPEHSWWTKGIPVRRGYGTTNTNTVDKTAFMFESDGTTAVTAGSTVTATTTLVLYAGNVRTVTTNGVERVYQGDHIRPGHQIILRHATDPQYDVNAKVLAVAAGTHTMSGASGSTTEPYTKITIRLLEDGNATQMATMLYYQLNGNINAEGGFTPKAITYAPVKYYNYTQIFRTSLDITRTARKTKLRTGMSYDEQKLDALADHAAERELAYLKGIPYEYTTADPTNNMGNYPARNMNYHGHPERTTAGLMYWVRQNASNNVFNFYTDTGSDYAGQPFNIVGEQWLDEKLETILMYGNTNNKIVLCGSGALGALNRIVKEGGNFMFTPQTLAYGIKIQEWHTAFGSIKLMTHPLLSMDPVDRYAMLFIDTDELRRGVIDDTMFMDSTVAGYDGTTEEWLTEDMLIPGIAEKFALCYAVGLTNGQ